MRRVRPALESEHVRILRQDPDKLFDQEAIRAKAREGDIYVDKGDLMTTHVRKPRGRPFERGNPGRPPGSKNKVTQIAEQLAEGQAEQVVQKLFELAQAGNVAALRMVLDRFWPHESELPYAYAKAIWTNLSKVPRTYFPSDSRARAIAPPMKRAFTERDANFLRSSVMICVAKARQPCGCLLSDC
jgi:hypothetical protein